MRATDAPPAGLASVVVPCFDRLEYTRQCVAALARHTRPPWELVAVDNGSTDGTAAYLAGVVDAGAFPVVVVTNPENRGFPAAYNQGLKAARVAPQGTVIIPEPPRIPEFASAGAHGVWERPMAATGSGHSAVRASSTDGPSGPPPSPGSGHAT